MKKSEQLEIYQDAISIRNIQESLFLEYHEIRNLIYKLEGVKDLSQQSIKEKEFVLDRLGILNEQAREIIDLWTEAIQPTFFEFENNLFHYNEDEIFPNVVRWSWAAQEFGPIEENVFNQFSQENKKKIYLEEKEYYNKWMEFEDLYAEISELYTKIFIQLGFLGSKVEKSDVNTEKTFKLEDWIIDNVDFKKLKEHILDLRTLSKHTDIKFYSSVMWHLKDESFLKNNPDNQLLIAIAKKTFNIDFSESAPSHISKYKWSIKKLDKKVFLK